MAEGYDKTKFRDQASQTSRQEMSGDYLYSEASSSRETSVVSQYLEWHQIREYDIVKQGHAAKKQKVEPKGAKCDNKKCIYSLSVKFALYLCYICNIFLCGECFVKHDITHECVSVEGETDERKRMAEMFVGRMRSERLGRGIDFDREDVRVYGRVNVKHILDKSSCLLTGLSGLDNKRWVAVDRNNYCIKIFCCVSNILLRYIKFGSQPWDVTEVTVKQKSTDLVSASDSKTNISVAALYERDKQCLLALAFPDIKQIWFIDVNKIPAVKNKSIEMKVCCYDMDFSDDKIFILCSQEADFGSDWSICILSSNGKQLKVIQDPGISFSNINILPDFAVCYGQVYLSDPEDNKVVCINEEDGAIISEITLEGSRPDGISVDRNSGVVYLCGRYSNKVYKLYPDLREYEPLSLDTDYTQRPLRLCFINSKLYITHLDFSSRDNVVTVVQLLT